MSALGYAVTRPFLEAGIDAALGFARMPLPSDSPVVHAPGPDSDRLLLLGTASVAGVGVVSHQLGLGGHLARRISAITGRGVDVEVVGEITLSVADARARVDALSLNERDAVILFVGSREAIGLQPLRIWKQQLRELMLSILESDGAPQIFVVGIPRISRYTTLPAHLGERIEDHITAQNSVAAVLCAQLPNSTFVPLAIGDDDSYVLGSLAYEQWAEQFAPVITGHLRDKSSRSRCPNPVDEEARQAALDALEVVGSDADARFDRIARTARDLLGASGASVTFLDHDRQWIKSAVTMSRDDTERAESFCNTTITRPELFVVEDATLDESFAGHPWVVGDEQVRFYAGYPVQAPNGERVGALCVVDTKPRHFTGSEAALLRELALRVQNLLWAG